MKRIHLLIMAALLIGGAVLMTNKTVHEERISAAQTETKFQASAIEEKKQPSKPEEKAVTQDTQILDELPTVDDLRHLSEEETHHTPVAIREGGKIIAKLIEKAENNPEIREKAVHVLHDCAKSETIATSIRAVCWKNTVTYIGKWKVFVPVSQTKLPPRVLELSSKLP